MKFFIHFFLLSLIYGCARSQKPGQHNSEAKAEQHAAATDALGKLKKLMGTDVQLQKTSFLKADIKAFDGNKINTKTEVDVSNLTLGRPIPTALIRIDSLRKYKEGKPISDLLFEGGQVIYPIIDRNNSNISTLTIEYISNNWKNAGFGLDKEAINAALPLLGSNEDSFKLLKIPSLHVYFLTYKKAGKTYLVPLQDDQQKGLKKNTEYLDQFVLSKYVNEAKLYNGLPR
jgi:hypothetical protein